MQVTATKTGIAKGMSSHANFSEAVSNNFFSQRLPETAHKNPTLKKNVALSASSSKKMRIPHSKGP